MPKDIEIKDGGGGGSAAPVFTATAAGSTSSGTGTAKSSAARAYKSMNPFSKATAELVWLKPPTARNGIWEEQSLTGKNGPGVAFCLTDVNNDGKTEVVDPTKDTEPDSNAVDSMFSNQNKEDTTVQSARGPDANGLLPDTYLLNNHLQFLIRYHNNILKFD